MRHLALVRLVTRNHRPWFTTNHLLKRQGIVTIDRPSPGLSTPTPEIPSAAGED